MLPVPIFKVPLTVVFTPKVVVPEFTVRLLKVVNTDDGKVLLAVMITVPVPGVQVPPPSVPIVIAPPILNVPPAVIFIVPVLPPKLNPSSCKLPAVMRDPLVKVITPTLLINKPTPPSTTAPETESNGLPLVAKVKVAVEKLLFPSCNEAQA